jgi:hypothetical protein
MAVSSIPVHLEQNPPNATFFSPHDAPQLAGILREWWSALPPGPHWQSEQPAHEQNRLDLINYGRKFLGIARNDTVALTPPGRSRGPAFS